MGLLGNSKHRLAAIRQDAWPSQGCIAGNSFSRQKGKIRERNQYLVRYGLCLMLADQCPGKAVQVIDVDVPGSVLESPDSWSTEPLQFRLEVLASEQPCGLGNVTINGVSLPQEQGKGVSFGEGLVFHERLVFASWSFNCINIGGRPERQSLNFIVAIIDGRAVDNVGFTTLFKQAREPEILDFQDTPFINPVNNVDNKPEHEHDHTFDVSQQDISQDVVELQWLKAQLRELEYLIDEKERSIVQHDASSKVDDIKNCDSLKCLMSTVFAKARHVGHELYGTIVGHEDNHWRGPPHHRKPHHGRKGRHGKHNEHHGNHTRNGDETHPRPPHWKSPHLPICRYPPPPFHHAPQHRPRPPFRHAPPPGVDVPPRRPAPNHRPFHAEDEAPPPPSPVFDDAEETDQDTPPPPPPPHHPPHHDHRPPPGEKHDRPPFILHLFRNTAVGFLLAVLIIALHRRFCSPRRFEDRVDRRERRQRRRASRRAARKSKLMRMFSRSSRDSDSSSEEMDEEKREALLADSDADTSVRDMEEGRSTIMSDDLRAFNNVADVISEMVAVDSQPSRFHPSAPPAAPSFHSRTSQSPDIQTSRQMGAVIEDYIREVGDNETLPAYEEEDDSAELGSVIADGFRYTPGSTDYTPSHSANSSMSDILGPDTKQ